MQSDNYRQSAAPPDSLVHIALRMCKSLGIITSLEPARDNCRYTLAAELSAALACDTSRSNITAYPCNLVDNMADVWQFDFVPLKLREKARLLLHGLCFNVWGFVQQQVLTGTAMAHFACLSSLRHAAVAFGCAAFLSEVDDCYAPDNLIGTWLNGAKICTFLCNPSKVLCLQSSTCTGVNA